MKSAETIPEMGEAGITENDARAEFNFDIL
jgi:hypothetical protein